MNASLLPKGGTSCENGKACAGCFVASAGAAAMDRKRPWPEKHVDECLTRLRVRQRTSLFRFARMRLAEGKALKAIAQAQHYSEGNARRLNTILLHVLGADSCAEAIILFHRELFEVMAEERLKRRRGRGPGGRRRDT